MTTLKYKLAKIKKEIYMKTTITINTSEIKSRVVWGFSPVTRVKQSKKVYNRKRMDKLCSQSQ